MNSKTLLFAAASAAIIAMSGCMTTPPYPVDGGGKSQKECTMTLDCQVKLSSGLWHTGYPDEILINVPAGKHVTITWTIEGNLGTTFKEDGGIFLKEPMSSHDPFTCKRDANKKHVFACTNNRDLTPHGTYTYGIKTEGVWAGPPVDPVIKN